MTRALAVVAAALTMSLSLAAADAAMARGTITYDGHTMTFQGDGGSDNVSVGPSQGELAWTTSGLDGIPAQCVAAEFIDYIAYCPWPQRIVVRLGGGNDRFSVSDAPWDPFPAHIALEAHGDDGDDRLQSAALMYGGGGNDTLEGHDGNQALHGGPGDDKVHGLAGSDQVFGDEGNDVLAGDGHKAASPDVVDGGPGVDAVEQDWGDQEVLVNLTLGGAADDGRSGEGDDVRGVEKVLSFMAGSFSGTDGADHIEVVQVTGPSTLNGGGGADFLKTSDGADTLNGGAGPDTLDGGFGDDVLVGGPGPDTIAGDHPSGECGLYWCKLPAGNDTIDARDGERDSITCGVGADTVKADPIDVVAPDCDRVERGAPGPGPALAKGKRCVVPKLRGLKLKAAKAKLAKAGCKTKVRKASSRRVGRGKVMGQSAKAGKRLKRGATVTVTVSRGR